MKDYVTREERLRMERGEGLTVLVLWLVVACLFGIDMWVRFA